MSELWASACTLCCCDPEPPRIRPSEERRRAIAAWRVRTNPWIKTNLLRHQHQTNESMKYQMRKLVGRTDVKERTLSAKQFCMSTCQTHKIFLMDLTFKWNLRGWHLKSLRCVVFTRFPQLSASPHLYLTFICRKSRNRTAEKQLGCLMFSRLSPWLDHSHDLIPAVLIMPQGVLQLINTFPRGFKNPSTPALRRGHEDTKSTQVGADLGSRWCSENPLRDICRDQTEGNTSCTVAAALHPRSRPPSSLPEDVHVLQSCLRFPLIVPIIHSSPCHPLTSLFCPFCQSHPPYFDLILLWRSPWQKKKKRRK